MNTKSLFLSLMAMSSSCLFSMHTTKTPLKKHPLTPALRPKQTTLFKEPSKTLTPKPLKTAPAREANITVRRRPANANINKAEGPKDERNVNTRRKKMPKVEQPNTAIVPATPQKNTPPTTKIHVATPIKQTPGLKKLSPKKQRPLSFAAFQDATEATKVVISRDFANANTYDKEHNLNKIYQQYLKNYIRHNKK